MVLRGPFKLRLWFFRILVTSDDNDCLVYRDLVCIDQLYRSFGFSVLCNGFESRFYRHLERCLVQYRMDNSYGDAELVEEMSGLMGISSDLMSDVLSRRRKTGNILDKKGRNLHQTGV